jgi:hypothetical protein
MIKYLIAYNVISSALNRFHYVQSVQRRHYPQITKYDRIVVSERELHIPGFKTILCPNFGTEDNLCVAASRNSGMRYAQKNGYDYVLLLDIDAVVLEDLFPIEPRKFSATNNYHSKEEEFKNNNYTGIYNSGPEHYDGGFYLFHKDILHLRWCEEFRGHFYEDIDFWYGVLDYDPVSPKATAARQGFIKTMHIWHPRRPDKGGSEMELKNRALFMKRYKEKYYEKSDWQAHLDHLKPFGITE